MAVVQISDRWDRDYFGDREFEAGGFGHGQFTHTESEQRYLAIIYLFIWFWSVIILKSSSSLLQTLEPLIKINYVKLILRKHKVTNRHNAALYYIIYN